MNLIYGANGSGKTTLARLFYECSSPDISTPSAGLELLTDIGGTSGKTTESDDVFWSRVHVFNSDYTTNNLRFDDDSGPSPDGLLTLGKPSVDAERELTVVKERLEEIQPQIQPARAALNKAQSELETRMSAIAGEVVTDLRTSPVIKYQMTNTYTKADVRAILVGDRKVLGDASKDLAKDRASATSSPMDILQDLTASGLADADDARAIEGLLSETVVAQAIESLKDHADRADWVQRGLPLHEGLSECLFCGQELTEARVRELAAHFDTSLTALQDKIDRMLAKLSRSSEQCKEIMAKLPRDKQVYGDLVVELGSIRSSVTADAERYLQEIESCLVPLQAKRDNPFLTVEPSATLVLEPPSVEGVNSVIQKHATQRQSHEDMATVAARRVEIARIASFVNEYDTRCADIEVRKKTLDDFSAELASLTARATSLQNVSHDPVPKAGELTRNVARLLGRGDLKFTIALDGRHYKIERNGEPARHLSEGEKTAIALLHYLGSVRKEVLAGDKPIVVIDDPVSSLDESILFGASAYLWSELVNTTYASQVFLLTHNFELFRQWLISLESARAHVTDGFTVHELRTRFRETNVGELVRWPQLEPWTEKEKLSRKLRSQYHFLFARVANTVIDASKEVGLAEQMELLALAPNAARKMMEAFLSFRFPDHIGQFHNGMRAACTKVEDQSIRTHVERYLHAYSHVEEGDLLAPLDPSEATVVLRSLFELMRAVDAEHLSAMCRSLKIDEVELFSLPGMVANEAGGDTKPERS